MIGLFTKYHKVGTGHKVIEEWLPNIIGLIFVVAMFIVLGSMLFAEEPTSGAKSQVIKWRALEELLDK